MSVHDHAGHEHTGPGYASPQVARSQPPEQFVYVAALYGGTGIDRPDLIAVVDVDPNSPSYGEIVHRAEMPNVGDELHHFGWNACSSACHSELRRDTLIVPGMRSSRIHLLDISDPGKPTIKNVIEGEELKQKLGLSWPHTVHCMPGDIVTISMLGDAEGNLPGGFAVLDARDFSVAERWEKDKAGQELMYDFWYQPRHNTLISSEWGAPNTFRDGFNPADVAAGKYGRRLHFWDLERRTVVQTLDLGRDGGHPKAPGALNGGPQMLQNSLDGERVYITNSLFSTWDNQFYPGINGWLTKLDRQPDGSYALDPDFFVDFHEQADGARPHEIHLPGGDCTTEIFQ